MSSSMDEEYVVYLEDLDEFVDGLHEYGDYPSDQYDNLYSFWQDKFKSSTALVVTDQMIADYMNDYDMTSLNNSLREYVKAGKVDVMWDSEKNDFAFKVVK